MKSPRQKSDRKSKKATARKPGKAKVPAQGCPVVAMGASAGGLEVFQQFFAHMPKDSGMGFVLIQHLDPNHETLIPDLLSKHTAMPVHKAVDGMAIEPNHIYVIPPKALLSLTKCGLKVTAVGRQPERMPIDHFFRSAAEDQEENVVCIVLSGIGTDGTLGLKAVKEHGGLAIAQSLETARYDSMPRSAISTGLVDYILRAEEMPSKILEYVKHLRRLQQKKGAESIQADAARQLNKIFPILRRRTGHDFSRYKQSTLIRRIQRRMQVVYADSVSKYIELLRRDLMEVDQLFKDLLIGVTQFFRDPEAFSSLQKNVIPEIFREKKSDSPIRIWVPGCASGEEAYSIAMLLCEHISQLEEGLPQVQIFATDLDNEALEFARKAHYPSIVAEQMSRERLDRFFIKHESTYEVVEEIREMCLFSPHNLIKDPPFSRLDLISCRNLLIYLEGDLQKRLLPLFHYALNSSGFLFLGPSENIASRSELFRTIDKKHRIFQRKPTVLRSHGHVPIMEPGRITRFQPSLPVQPGINKEQNVARTIERLLLEEYAPASVVINDQGEVLYFSGRTGKYLEPPAGVPNNKLINMARKTLRLELRTAVHRATITKDEVIREKIPVRAGRDTHYINLIVRPLSELGRDSELYIVIFQETASVEKNAGAMPQAAERIDYPVVQQLEDELRTTKEDLQTTIEELETSNEELKSANEELLSMNEELQSTNEELQTSKEELQSLNDELQRKLEELDGANSDLQNLFQGAQIATVFIDNQLQLKKFTPSINQVIYLTDRDIGRYLLDAAPQLGRNDVLADVEEVFRTLSHKERQITLDGGRTWYLMRIIPYRNTDQVVLGAVITFSDVSDLKKAQDKSAQLAAIVLGLQDAVVGKTLDGTITSWNPAAEKMYGYSVTEAIGRNISFLVPSERLSELPALFEKLGHGKGVASFETVRVTKDGRRLSVSLTLSPIHDFRGHIVGISGIDRDVTERQKAEKALKDAEEKLRLHAEDLEKQVTDRTAHLKETIQSLEGVCYTIAHDLRAPLRAMQGFTRILLEDYASSFDAEGRDYASRIAAAASRMDILIRDLLDYARLSHLELPSDKIDLELEVRQLLGHLASEIQSKEAYLSVAPLPVVWANQTVLEQILTNLLSNALKFVKPDIRPRIEIWAKPMGEMTRLYIKDNGIGIEAEHHERIFGLFQRLHETETYPGTGVGLAIVKKGIERMGGRVGVESTPGKGSCFYFDLKSV